MIGSWSGFEEAELAIGQRSVGATLRAIVIRAARECSTTLQVAYVPALPTSGKGGGLQRTRAGGWPAKNSTENLLSLDDKIGE
jgi:hypothetical protein